MSKVVSVFSGRAKSNASQNHSKHKVVSMDVAAFCAFVPFGEVVMAKIADADKMRAKKLDSAWVKTVLVKRVDRSNEHL